MSWYKQEKFLFKSYYFIDTKIGYKVIHIKGKKYQHFLVFRVLSYYSPELEEYIFLDYAYNSKEIRNIIKVDNERFKGYINNVNKVIKIGEEIWK